MNNLKDKYLHFKNIIQELEKYESKNFFGKLFSSDKPNENEIVLEINNFITNTLLKEIAMFQSIENFKVSLKWFLEVKDFIEYENVFKLLQAYQDLSFLNDKMLLNIENYRLVFQNAMREREKLENIFEKHNII
ncbi:hypothetical protein [Polaribacter sp. IC073]|uniref:hypothetical protein n=1 Tax=Polaribacter sp. IC073 TaxID=2508540 RepID=UPI0011BD8423|nr:hypothetical protein [Polaribacter sp. IC073]TXD48683.1 hypothetical protein ES045_05505 [Polaribacter sp. IC073]